MGKSSIFGFFTVMVTYVMALRYSEEGGGYLTAVLVTTSCLVKFSNVSEWQFSKVQAH